MTNIRKINRINNIDVDFPVDPVSETSKNEAEKSEPQIIGEQSESGTMPDPELIQDKDSLEMAQDVGLYTENDDEHPSEVNLSGELDKDERNR